MDSHASYWRLRLPRRLHRDLRLLCGHDGMPPEHWFGLQDFVGEGVPQHYCHDFGLTPDIQSDEVPVAPSSVDALAHRPIPVLLLPLVTGHARAPCGDPWAVSVARLVGIAAMFGLGRWTMNGPTLVVSPFDILVCPEATVGKMVARQTTKALADFLQHRTHQTTVRTHDERLDRHHDLLSSRADHLDVVCRTISPIRHLHDPPSGLRPRFARRFLLFRLAALSLQTALALYLYLAQGLERRLHLLDALARRPLARRSNASVAGARLVIKLAFELFHHLLGACQMLLQARAAAVRSRPPTGAYPHAILRQPIQINDSAGFPRRHVLDQQPIEKLAIVDAEVAQRVVVDRHPAAQPAIRIMAFAQPLQGPCASHPLAGRVKPQRQQQARRNCRMSRHPLPRFDRILQLAQINLLHVIPNQSGRMVLPDQTVDIHRPQLDLVPLRLAPPRPPHT